MPASTAARIKGACAGVDAAMTTASGPEASTASIRPASPPTSPATCLCTLRVGVADEYLVHAGVAGQHAGVQGADTAGSEQSDLHPTSSTPSSGAEFVAVVKSAGSRWRRLPVILSI